ncbi:MAG: rhodanese-like domain-containing protein [Alphaproteobacteria bacterium]
MTSVQDITAAGLAEIPAHAVVLDVRTAMEHDACRLRRPHQHVPLDQIDPERFLREHGCGSDVPLYLLCRSGGRARRAAERFVAAGCRDVYVIAGGLEACRALGQEVTGHAASPSEPSVHGPITLERQVRIAAGTLVALGALLALVWETGFAVLPLFVGCGLIFAGVTDRCGMALLLTKAPWNRPVSSQPKE